MEIQKKLQKVSFLRFIVSSNRLKLINLVYKMTQKYSIYCVVAAHKVFMAMNLSKTQKMQL